MENHICFICDEGYVMPTWVAISSLERHIDRSLNNRYICHIFTFGLSEESCAALTALSRPDFTVAVTTVDPAPYRERLDAVTQNSHVTKSALLKFELPNLLPDCERVLYLDSDVIIRKDLSELFTVDFSGCCMAAVEEYWAYYDRVRYCFGTFRRREKHGFNAGFLLCNLPKMRADGIPDKLWETKRTAGTFLMDQYCLDTVITEYHHLPIRYNFSPMYLAPFNARYFNRIYGTHYRNIREAVDDAAVIHYVCGGAKPWLCEDAAMGKLWEEEYAEIGGEVSALTRKKTPIRHLPEFCKGFHDVWQGKTPFLRALSYVLLILTHLRYYRKLILHRKYR